MPPTAHDRRTPPPAKTPATDAREELRLARQAETDKAAPTTAQPANVRPGAATPRGVLALQRRFGNRAVNQTIVQPKLQVGPADDPYEREADRMAERVVRGPVAAPPPPTGPGAAVQRQTLAASARTASGGAHGLVQLKRAIVSAKTTTRLPRAPLPAIRPDAKPEEIKTARTAAAKAVDKASKGTQHEALASVDVEDNDAQHVKDGADNLAWYKLQGAPEYIKASKVMAGLTAAPVAPDEPVSGEDFDKAGYSGTMVTRVDDLLVEKIRSDNLAGGASNSLIGGETATWAASGLLGMAVSMRDLFKGEASAWDRVNAALSLGNAASGFVGAVAQAEMLAVGPTTEQGKAAATDSAWAYGFADMFATLASAVKTLKGIVDLVKLVASAKREPKGAYLATGGDILVNGLETAKGVLRSIRGVQEALAGGTTGTMFAQVLPGLDIAIASVKSIMQGYYLIVSAVDWYRMNQHQDQLQLELAGRGYTQPQITAALKQYKHEEAMSAKLADLSAQTQVKIDAQTATLAKLPEGPSAKRTAATEKLTSLTAKKAGYDQKKAELDAASRAGDGQGGPTRAELEEVDLSSDLALANKRRVTRQAVHISTNLAQIAGAIATLVSGPGAPAALALKLAAAGIDASLPFFRWLKQKGRDTAAKNVAKGETGLSNKIFNADKTTAAKLAARKKQAVVILMMVQRLNDLIPPARAQDPRAHALGMEALKAQVKRVELYISASGCPPERLYEAAPDAGKQISVLVKELSRRELA